MKPRTTDQMTHDAATRDPIGAMTPRQIVEALNRYIVGQDQAKRAVAIALRNRWRRQHLPEGLRQEVMPKNILMIGPTGVGKTEIARRVATIADAPFLKVEATKFTEVGYVGRDVETIVRDLVEVSIGMLHGQRLEAVREEASSAAIQRLADLLIEQRAANRRGRRKETPREAEAIQDPEQRRRHEANVRRRLARQRARMLDLLQKEALEDETVELETDQEFDAIIPLEFAAGMSPEELHETFSELLEGFAPRRRSRKVSVREARQILTQQEANRLVDFDSVVEEAVRRAEEHGIIFIDEIDKLINPNGDYGPDVSGEGVQRDLLPIVEGSVVNTRYGPIKTDHILFIAAGSFQTVRPSDLIPELQGRFPIRVELDHLSEDDLFAILTQPDNALTRQYQALLAAEDVELVFTEDGLREIARIAAEVNARTEDIGARRLHTIVERVLEDISFEAPDRRGERVVIDRDYVLQRVEDIAADDDLSKFIL
ncbi:heat shock protein HslVU, ATPase subunit HslU [Sphaerobacter thermophilus DSM 20745]|uniref:Heat shock protein HslVU, ATPase subunit HslU n=2 Tax=Sphaerobacter TaxID=2056 RepID=D1C6Z0_SPHTD|nr:heat shock protein HslVU, ATPase subunit HslU [Sphaerobacter thermophilus DSM 20745]